MPFGTGGGCENTVGCSQVATQRRTGVPGRLAACIRGGVENVSFGVGPTTQSTPFHHSVVAGSVGGQPRVAQVCPQDCSSGPAGVA